MSEKNKRTLKTQTLRTRASYVAESFNEETRTVSVIFATETAVRMYSYDDYEHVDEVLICKPENGNLDRLNNGAPALDNHNSRGKAAEITVGVTSNARFENGIGYCDIRFGKTEYDTQLMEKVRDGIITGISVGYTVQEYTVTRSDGKRPIYMATKWEATEVSFAPVQADANSRVRSSDSEGSETIILEEKQENQENMPETKIDEQGVRALASSVAKETLENERKRVKQITQQGRSMGLKTSLIQSIIDEGLEFEVANTRMLAEWEKKDPIIISQTGIPIGEDRQRVLETMGNALAIRANSNVVSILTVEEKTAARNYSGRTFLQLAEEALQISGVNTRNLSNMEIAKAALGARVRGMHHTTDFPILLLNTVNRTLLANYEIQPRTFTRWSRRETISDFRPITRVKLSEMLGNLEEVKEGGEYTSATFSEKGETYKLSKFGKMLGITWESIINDDLSAFNKLPGAFAAAASRLQNKTVYSMITTGGFAAMSDGNALFSAAHGNFTGTANSQTAGGTALSKDNLTAAYTAMRKQKNAAGDSLNIKPKYLIVGPDNEAKAYEMVSTNFMANVQGNIVPKFISDLEIVVDSEITGWSWFLAADYNAADTVEHAFLSGHEDLFLDQEEQFNTDGINMKARLVFGAKAIDWVGLYRNNGAALS